jgi:hypothetical protein
VNTFPKVWKISHWLIWYIPQVISDKTVAEPMFLLNKLLEAKDTAAPRHNKIIALKQYEPMVHASIKIPANIPAKADATGEWNIENAVSKGNIKTGEAPEMLIAILSV